MPEYVAKADTTYARVNRQWVYDRIEGAAGAAGILQYQLVVAAWVYTGGAWRLYHRDGGVMAATNLSVTINQYPNASEIEFLASWNAAAPESPYDDYEITNWYADGSPVSAYGFRVMRQPSVPGQYHTVSFFLRRKARTDGDAGGHTAASAPVWSGDFILQDARNPF